MLVQCCLLSQDFLCILQDKHHNTAVHSQSHQLLFCKMCMNSNENCLLGHDKIIKVDNKSQHKCKAVLPTVILAEY